MKVERVTAPDIIEHYNIFSSIKIIGYPKAGFSPVGLIIDIYFQVGLLTLIGLSAKNAILIVEFSVVSSMLTATTIAIFFIPTFFCMIYHFIDRNNKK